MRTIVFAAGVVVAVLGSGLSSVRAEVLYPWCFQEVSEAGYVSCAYSTYDQCMASRHGQSGFCSRNALYDANASQRSDATAKPRKAR